MNSFQLFKKPSAFWLFHKNVKNQYPRADSPSLWLMLPEAEKLRYRKWAKDLKSAEYPLYVPTSDIISKQEFVKREAFLAALYYDPYLARAANIQDSERAFGIAEDWSDIDHLADIMHLLMYYAMFNVSWR